MYDSRDLGPIKHGSATRADVIPGAEDVHPLVHIRTLVDDICKGAAVGAARCAPLIRAALLQALYSFPSHEQLLEQLQYNALYRWFVGLRSDELPWRENEYAAAIDTVTGDERGRVLFNRAVVEAHAYAALMPSRFRVDVSLIERFTRRPEPVQADVERPRGDSTRTARLDRARNVILRRIADPALDADAIAAELFMSRRALYLLFERYGLTPTRAIREIRLDCCMRLLRDERHGHRKITDIAMDHGFQHFASFSRQFKQRYGISPSAVRGARQLVIGPRRGPMPDLEHAAIC